MRRERRYVNENMMTEVFMMDRWNWNQRIIEESNADFHTRKVRENIKVGLTDK